MENIVIPIITLILGSFIPKFFDFFIKNKIENSNDYRYIIEELKKDNVLLRAATESLKKDSDYLREENFKLRQRVTELEKHVTNLEKKSQKEKPKLMG